MTDFTQKVIERLDRFEANKLLPYDDSTGHTFVPGMTLHGNLSIGRGCNLHKGISSKMSDIMTQEDIDTAYMHLLYLFPDYQFFSEARRLALMDVAYHMGASRFRGFKKMIAAIKAGEWETASLELMDSKYGKDERFSVRAHENAEMIRNG